MKHAGVDYSDPAQVAVYDERHQKFRDYKKGAQAIIDALALGRRHGRFYAARRRARQNGVR